MRTFADRASPFLLALLLAVGCGGEPADPNERGVAEIGDESLTLAELQGYLDANLLTGEEDTPLPASEMAAVQSRLLDALIEERLLLSEAESRGVLVEPIEIEAYLEATGVESEEGGGPPPAARREAERRLKIEKLLESIALEQPPVDEAEARSRAGERRAEREVELRALMLEDLDQAERVHRDMKRRRITFAEAVAAHGSGPGQGLPLRLAWEGLSEEVRAALDGLKPGQVSGPIEMLGNIYLFKVERWIDEPGVADVELARRALEAERRQQAYRELLDELRAATRVRIRQKNLPFRYVPAETP
jgi:parvulin-like peptidyl-prolyl isomerase